MELQPLRQPLLNAQDRILSGTVSTVESGAENDGKGLHSILIDSSILSNPTVAITAHSLPESEMKTPVEDTLKFRRINQPRGRCIIRNERIRKFAAVLFATASVITLYKVNDAIGGREGRIASHALFVFSMISGSVIVGRKFSCCCRDWTYFFLGNLVGVGGAALATASCDSFMSESSAVYSLAMILFSSSGMFIASHLPHLFQEARQKEQILQDHEAFWKFLASKQSLDFLERLSSLDQACEALQKQLASYEQP